MVGEETQAQQIFQDTVREAAFLAANGEAPPDRYWFFREARWRCLADAAKGVQPEKGVHETADVSEEAPDQIAQLEPEQFAAWVSATPEPQRSALALYYLDGFSYREILSITGLKLNELAAAIESGRREFQAWLNATAPVETK
jgi:DNA-directed RNA polymerase specialized sigma24 family protein